VFTLTHKGVSLQTEAEALEFLPQIYQQVTVSKTMPLGNKTQMTDAERDLITSWVNQQIQTND
jgi:uncharacterized membrane protein